MNDLLEKTIESLINQLCKEYNRKHRSELLWEALVLDGNFALVEKLHYAERKLPGYNIIVVPFKGFSESDQVHNMVLDWCKEHKIKTLNILHEVAALERTQTWKTQEQVWTK
jgi:hypothetical protein